MTAGAQPAPRHAGPFLLALWFGLAGGLAESMLYALQRFVLDHYTRLSIHQLWTAPIGEAALLLIPAPLLWLLARRLPRPFWLQATVSLYAFVTVMGVLFFSYGLHWLARDLLAAGLAVQIGRVAAGRRELMTAVVRRTLPVLAAVVALLAVATVGSIKLQERRALASLPAAAPGSPNVLLLILDTVRALDLSVYGYGLPTTPALEQLAGRGVVFDRAIAPSSWTLASHAALFTGRAPNSLSADWEVPLDTHHRTLAEALRDRGYVTAGFAANLVYVTRESGLGRGFAHFDSEPVTAGSVIFSARAFRVVAESKVIRALTGCRDLLWRRPADGLRTTAAGWLDAHQGRPWFAFVNFYDAHNPYLPPAPWDTLFTGRKVPWRERNLWVEQSEPVTVEQARTERDAYDNALAYLDHELGLFLADLERRGLLRNTIVVVTSDHGEEFGEHGLLGHGNSLYFQSLHVPLIIAADTGMPAGRRVAQTVSLTNLAATLLDLAGAADAIPGRSLRETWTAPDNSVPRDSTAPFALSEIRRARGLPEWFPVSKGDLASVLAATHQLIRGGEGREELFDVLVDPPGNRLVVDSATSARLRSLYPAVTR